MSELVHYQLREGVATIALNDGKVNVMSAAMLQAIHKALDKAEEAGAIVLLRSERPGVFSAGFDVKVLASGNSEATLEMMQLGAELALRLMSHPCPTIGVLEGHAFPMGAFLLLACDFRIASEGTQKIGLNEVAIGITPPHFAIELARSRLHPAWLSRTVALGEMFEPTEALQAGFVDRVVKTSAMDAGIAEATASMKSIHGPSHTRTKHRLRLPVIEAMREAIDKELTLENYQSTGTGSSVVLPGDA